jgi:hypothetical protein
MPCLRARWESFTVDKKGYSLQPEAPGPRGGAFPLSPFRPPLQAGYPVRLHGASDR